MAEIVVKQLSSDDAGNYPKTQLRQWVPVPPTPESRPNVNFFDQGFSWPGRYADEMRVATASQRLAPTGCHLSDDMESTASTAKERLECKHCTLSIHLTVLCNYSLHSLYPLHSLSPEATSRRPCNGLRDSLKDAVSAVGCGGKASNGARRPRRTPDELARH